jgi:hypothetical protein
MNEQIEALMVHSGRELRRAAMKTAISKLILGVMLISLPGLACQSTSKIISQGSSTLDETQPTYPEIPPKETLIPNTGEGGSANSSTGLNQGFSILGQTGGSAFAVAAAEKVVYLGQGPRVIALDVSNPQSPQVIGESDVLPGLVQGIALSEKHLYAAVRYGGLNILDVSDPHKLVPVGSALPEGSGGCNAVVIENQTAYLACNPGGLLIVDIGIAEKPQVLSTTAAGAAISIVKKGKFVYLSNISKQNLSILDVSDPSNPVEAGSFDLSQIPGSSLGGTIYSVKGCGENLCLAVGLNGLIVLELSDPAAPQYLGRFPSMVTSGLALDGNLAVLADDMDGIHFVDLSNPSNPVETGALTTSVGGWELSVEEGQERGMFLLDQRLYITDPTYGLAIVDVSKPGAPVRIGQYMTPLPNWLQGIRVMDDKAYIIGRYSGFRVVDVSQPAAPQETAYDDTRRNLYTQNPSELIISEPYAYISDLNYPFHIVDISKTGVIKQTGAVYDEAASDGASDMVISGKTAYLAGWGGKDAFYPGDGIWAVDVTDANSPAAIGFVETANENWHLALGNGYLFALDSVIDKKDNQPLSLRVFSLADPKQPNEVLHIPIPDVQGGMTDLLVDGNYLYISTPVSGILVYDISLPTQPNQIAILPFTLPGSPKMTLSKNTLIVGGQMAYDVSDVNNPQFSGVVGLTGAWDCALEGDLVYVITQMQGLYVFRFTPLR